MVPFRSYQVLGNLEILFDAYGRAEDYRRERDLETGVARVEYRIGRMRHVRDVSMPSELLPSAFEPYLRPVARTLRLM